MTNMITKTNREIEKTAQGLEFAIQAGEELEELVELTVKADGVADLTAVNYCREVLRKVKCELAYDLYKVINGAIVELELTDQEGGAE